MTGYGYRSGVIYRGPSYTAGLELSFTGGTSPPVQTDVDGLTATGSSTSVAFDVGPLVGRHARFGRVDLGVEGAALFRLVSVSPPLPPGYSACAPDQKGCKGPLVNATTFLVEGRAHAWYWVTRHLTLGVTVGADIALRDESFAVDLIFHIPAYDGT
jgi:hypothetical protein